MGRVLRLLRLVKTIQGFDALYIMTTAMQGSVTVLFWSFVRLGNGQRPREKPIPRLLMVVQTLIAFTLNQALDSYFRDQSKPAPRAAKGLRIRSSRCISNTKSSSTLAPRDVRCSPCSS